MNLKTISILLLLVVNHSKGITFGLQQISLPPIESQKIDEMLLAEVKSQKLAGIAVAVVRQGEPVYVGTCGWANIENQVAVSRETIFNWASNSKPVMAVAAMQLVEQGKLDLDADVRLYVPEFPAKEHVITTRHLLCHQSGIPHYSNGKVVPDNTGRREAIDDSIPALAMRRFANSPLIFQPGDRREYSSYAYLLLSAVVERAGGAPIDQQLRERIIGPLGMKSFQMDWPRNEKDVLHKDWATGYALSPRGQLAPVRDVAHGWKHGAGGYKSNIEDFARWAGALLEPTLIRKETESQMFYRQKLNSGKQGDYGLGFLVDGEGDFLRISHGGSQDETRTHLVIWPNQEIGVVVMSNSQQADPAKIANAIARLLLTD